jgi:hypothetical protein
MLLAKEKFMTTETAHLEFAIPFPVPEITLREKLAGATEITSADVRSEFEKITQQTPRDIAAEQAFIASKLHMIRTHPTLHRTERKALIAEFESMAKDLAPERYTGPIPGGTGYGMYYNAPFKTNFSTGTAIYFEIVCPTPPGGNVNTFLYLTATNRSAKGIEAFLSYDGQNQTYFKVFDWARFPAEPWQTNIPFANLGNYLTTRSAHGHLYQVLPLMNFTFQSGTNLWSNQAWLFNRVANRWDLVYQYSYSATQADQKTGFIGSWGPIVETFQSSYNGTNPMGTLSTQLTSRDNSNQWGGWYSLSATDSYTRTDNIGFYVLFLDSNYSWIVDS